MWLSDILTEGIVLSESYLSFSDNNDHIPLDIYFMRVFLAQKILLPLKTCVFALDPIHSFFIVHDGHFYNSNKLWHQQDINWKDFSGLNNQDIEFHIVEN